MIAASTRRLVRLLSMAALLYAALGVRTAAAQVFTPTFMPPSEAPGLGAALSSGPGGFSDLAAEWIWRAATAPGMVGLRAGIADRGDASLIIGGEYRTPPRTWPELPLQTAFTFGAQAMIGDTDDVGVQAGVTAGREFDAEGLLVTPYLHPRLALVHFADDTDLELLADLGADFRFATGWLLRVSLGFGDDTSEAGVAVVWP